MSLRTQYSLRQAIPIALFGVPMYVLEQMLGRVISNGDVELGVSSLGAFAFLGMPCLGALTYLFAYERFHREFDLPLSRFHLSWLRIIPLFLLISGSVSLGAVGWPTNEYHWARLGIIGLGMVGGLMLFKWIYFDWLDRLGDEPPTPDDLEGTGRAVPPITPLSSASGRSFSLRA